MTEQTTLEREETQRLNREALLSLVEQHPSIHIPRKNQDEWRPTKPTLGVITGLEHVGELTCVCTDGIQAWFLRPAASPFIGHVGNFKWNEGIETDDPWINDEGVVQHRISTSYSGVPPTLFGATKEPKFRKERTRKLSMLEQALSLLRGSGVAPK